MQEHFPLVFVDDSMRDPRILAYHARKDWDTMDDFNNQLIGISGFVSGSRARTTVLES